MGKLNSERLGLIIKGYLIENDLKVREFARKVDVSHTYVTKLIKGYNDYGQPIEPGIITLTKLARGMGMSLLELLIQSGYIEKKELHRYIYGSELKKMLPDGYKDLDLEYIELAKDIKNEAISPQIIKKMIDILTKYDK